MSEVFRNVDILILVIFETLYKSMFFYIISKRKSYQLFEDTEAYADLCRADFYKDNLRFNESSSL
ncbi:MAG TPA: hypothetical protein DD740_05340 [Chryseobacterium sp.]|nr:hypothetical protein [Chryseobacterium sp.]